MDGWVIDRWLIGMHTHTYVFYLCLLIRGFERKWLPWAPPEPKSWFLNTFLQWKEPEPLGEMTGFQVATWCEEPTHGKRPWYWERLKVGGEGDDRGWKVWMASLTWWTWVWVDSRSWWWSGRPEVLQSMGFQRVGHDWTIELNSLHSIDTLWPLPPKSMWRNWCPFVSKYISVCFIEIRTLFLKP